MAPISSTGHMTGYAYILSPPVNQSVDGEDVHSTEQDHVVIVNGTLIRILLKKPFRDSQLNELLYVIIVIVFYATALMTLIITQIKRQKREGSDVDYYDEYLQRNQEVKRTCQTATSLFRKSDKPSFSTSALAASAHLSMKMGSSCSLLDLPSRARDQSPRSSQRKALSSLGVGVGRGGGEEEVSLQPPGVSPILESIPDIET